MADKKKKPQNMHKDQASMQRYRDLERLEQIRYTGQLLEMESSLIKSQIQELKRPNLTDPTQALVSKSQSAVYLPPIKKLGIRDQRGFLNEVKARDWKLYMSSKQEIEGNAAFQQQNEELKRKLFKQKYRHYVEVAKKQCIDKWQRLEELQKKQGPRLDDPSMRASSMKESVVLKSVPEKPAPKAPVSDTIAKKPVATVDTTAKKPVATAEKADPKPTTEKRNDGEF